MGGVPFFSKKTTHLLVGELPGQSKLDQATRMGIRRVKLQTLLDALRNGDNVEALNAAIDAAADVEVAPEQCSNGFGKNAKRFKMAIDGPGDKAPLLLGCTEKGASGA